MEKVQVEALERVSHCWRTEEETFQVDWQHDEVYTPSSSCGTFRCTVINQKEGCGRLIKARRSYQFLRENELNSFQSVDFTSLQAQIALISGAPHLPAALHIPAVRKVESIRPQPSGPPHRSLCLQMKSRRLFISSLSRLNHKFIMYTRSDRHSASHSTSPSNSSPTTSMSFWCLYILVLLLFRPLAALWWWEKHHVSGFCLFRLSLMLFGLRFLSFSTTSEGKSILQDSMIFSFFSSRTT